MAHSYRELTAPELLTWFVKLTGGYINKGRDARMLHVKMQERGLQPTEILYAMYVAREDIPGLDIPTFCRLLDDSDFPDISITEALLVTALTGKDIPTFVLAYWELLDAGLASAQVENYLEQASVQLKEYLDDVLDKPAAIRVGSRATKRREQSGSPYADPGKWSRSG